jgi:hypothetical protein
MRGHAFSLQLGNEQRAISKSGNRSCVRSRSGLQRASGALTLNARSPFELQRRPPAGLLQFHQSRFGREAMSRHRWSTSRRIQHGLSNRRPDRSRAHQRSAAGGDLAKQRLCAAQLSRPRLSSGPTAMHLNSCRNAPKLMICNSFSMKSHANRAWEAGHPAL